MLPQRQQLLLYIKLLLSTLFTSLGESRCIDEEHCSGEEAVFVPGSFGSNCTELFPGRKSLDDVHWRKLVMMLDAGSLGLEWQIFWR